MVVAVDLLLADTGDLDPKRRIFVALLHHSTRDMYSVSAQTEPDSDIILQSGLDEGFGFVINPGRNILGDIFGVRAKPVSCQRV